MEEDDERQPRIEVMSDDDDDDPAMMMAADMVPMEEADIPDDEEDSDSGPAPMTMVEEEEGEQQPEMVEVDPLAMPGEPGYEEPSETLSQRRKRMIREEEAYYEDEYGDANPEMVRCRHTDVSDFFEDPRIIDEEDEPEEHVHGMILPTMDLTDTNLYYRELFRVICAMGTELTRLLTQLLVSKTPITPPDRNRCNAWVKYWTSYLIEHHYDILGKVISIPTGPNGEAEKISGSMCIMGELWRMKLILNHHRIDQIRGWKISASPFLLKWLVEIPEKAGGVPLDAPPKVPVMKDVKGGIPTEADKAEHKKKCVAYAAELEGYNGSKRIIETPILALKQTQIRKVVQFLTARLKVIPYHEDIRMLIETLELKNAMFFCQTMPGTQLNDDKFRTDMQKEVDRIVHEMQATMRERVQQGQATASEYADAMRDAFAHQQQQLVDASTVATASGKGRFTVNRDYWIFCTCFFYPLTRALYYVDMFPLMQLERAQNVESYLPKGSVERLEKWCREMAKHQGDKYSDRLVDAADDALNHDGDMEWHLYRHPDESTNVAVVLRKTRGEAAYEDYHVQTDLSATATLDLVNINWLSTVYVINLIDRYFSTYKSTNWQDGYVIHSPFIDDPETFDKWTISREPFLINVFNNFWLMLDRKVLPINNVYVAVCMWMMAIRKTRRNCATQEDCLSDNTYIGDVIDTILLGKGNISYTSQKTVEEEYQQALARGLPVTATRLHI